jgi:hypothetical protein
MGKKLSKNKKTKTKNDVKSYKSIGAKKDYEIKFEKDPIEILNRKREMIEKIEEKRKNELYNFLFSNVPMENKIKKNKINNISPNRNPIFPLTTQFGYDVTKISSNLFLISKDIIVVLTNKIFNEEKGYSKTLEINDLNLQLEFGNNNEININKYILENDENHNFFSIIKLINEEFSFENFFDIDSDLDILSESKFIIDDKGEEMIGISISENDIASYNPGTPIIIKKNNKQYFVGIINSENHYYIFNRTELLDIKKN